ncbi:MAG: hypothetical protein U0Y68_20865 [Blastocatellia bacterium]
MLIAKSSHQAVVAAKDAQIAYLKQEVEYYRTLVLGLRSLPDREAVLTAPATNEAPQPRRFGADWDENEWANYNNWAQMQMRLYAIADPEELATMYAQTHGNNLPSVVMSAD